METSEHIYDIHLFVCTNQRELPRTGCGDLGSLDFVTQLKKEISNTFTNKKGKCNKLMINANEFRAKSLDLNEH